MNKRTVVIGTLTIAGLLYVIFSPEKGTPLSTCADLIEQGIASPDCHPAILGNLTLHMDDFALDVAIDAGLLLERPNQHYVYADTLTLVWDGGLYPPLLKEALASAEGSPHVQVVERDQPTLRTCDAFCARAFPLRFTLPPCWVPKCWDDAGVWDDSMVVDCKKSDWGGDRWAGCSVIEPPSRPLGADCVPVVCSITSANGTDL